MYANYIDYRVYVSFQFQFIFAKNMWCERKTTIRAHPNETFTRHSMLNVKQSQTPFAQGLLRSAHQTRHTSIGRTSLLKTTLHFACNTVQQRNVFVSDYTPLMAVFVYTMSFLTHTFRE